MYYIYIESSLMSHLLLTKKKNIMNFKCPSLTFLIIVVLTLYSCKVKKKESQTLPVTCEDKIEELENQIARLNEIVNGLQNKVDYIEPYDPSIVPDAVKIYIANYLDNTMSNINVEAYDPEPTVSGNDQGEIKTVTEDVNQAVSKDTIISTDLYDSNENMSSAAFYCPETMKENETYNLFAFIKPLNNDEVKQKLLNAVNEAREERGESLLNEKDLRRKDIILGRYIKIELLDPTNKRFTILPVQRPGPITGVDIYDEEAANYFNDEFLWRWSVTPKVGAQGKATLKFKVTPYDKNNKKIKTKITEFPIEVEFENSFLEEASNLAIRDPEWAIASIITPFLTFLAGFFVKKKKQDKADKGQEA